MRQETIRRIGTTGRKIPGLASLLDLRAARIERNLMRRRLEHARQVFDEAIGRPDLRLNVGAGPSSVDGWLNVDIEPEETSGSVMMDATDPWPLPDASVEAVNSEHFLEHIEPEEATRYFAEAYRVLRPGGVIRTSTPDLEGLMQAYLKQDKAALKTHRAHGYEARNITDLVNNYVYSWGHKHIYDYATLALMLERAGFERIERVAFGESSHPVLRGVDTHDMDDLGHLVVSVDAVKPG